MSNVEINLEKTINEMLPEGYKLEDLTPDDYDEIVWWYDKMIHIIEGVSIFVEDDHETVPTFNRIYTDCVNSFISDYYNYLLSDMKDEIIRTIDSYPEEEGE